MNSLTERQAGSMGQRWVTHLCRPFGSLVILMLICIACSMPSFNPKKVVSTSTSVSPVLEIPVENTVVEATPPVTFEYAPGLVEVSPPPQSDLAQGAAPVFYFNQPMNRNSVEDSLKLDPPISIQFEWLDDATLRLIPDSSDNLRQGVSVTINTGAKAVNGMSLTAPIQVSYRTAEDLIVTQRLPEPGSIDVNPSSAVVITFNKAMVALGDEQAGLLPAFTIEPPEGMTPPDGHGEWINTSTYIFYPLPPLIGGSHYDIRIDPELTSIDGSTIRETDLGQAWDFSTTAPMVVALQPGSENYMELDDAIVLGFNQPMNTASIEADFSLVRPDGSLVPGKFNWNDNATEVTFKPTNLLDRDTTYGLVLFGSASSQGGTPLGQDFVASFSTVPLFGVSQTAPAAGETLQTYFGQATVMLTFNSPVASGQDFNRLISLSPAINGQTVYISPDGYQLYLSGFFQPSTSYTLEISPELTDRWETVLGLPFSFTFSIVPASPSIYISGNSISGQAVFVPYGEGSLPASSTNIERLSLSSGEISIDEFIQGWQDWEGIQNWEPKVKLRWVDLLYPTPNITETIEIPLHPSGDLLKPGLYFLKVDTQPVIENAGTSPELIVVSPIHLVFKTSLRQAFVWAVHIADQTPIEGVKVTIFNKFASVVTSCETNTQGICQADLPVTEDPYMEYYAVIGQPGDADFSLAASNWSQGLTPWEFDIPYEQESYDPKVYLYTDRPIYRPGQAVNLRAVVRNQNNGRYSPSDLKEITLDVISPYDPVTSQSPILTTLRMSIDSFGSASGSYTLPENARTGDYTLRVHDIRYADITFQVAEYRKPEIDLQVEFSKSDNLFGDDIRAQVNARYFFGAPAGNVTLNWVIFAERSYPDMPDGLQVGLMDTSWMDSWSMFGMMSQSITEGQGTTSPDGTFEIVVPGSVFKERVDEVFQNQVRLTLEATITDESGLPVSARDSMSLHPSSYYIGVRPESWSVSAGDEVLYSVRTVDWQGNPLKDRQLFARFSKVLWRQEDNAVPDAPPQYFMDETEVGSTEFITSETGEARLAFSPAEPGTFMVEITGEGGAITQSLIWVGGTGSAVWPSVPNQRILLRSDADQYLAGSKAKIFIPNPFSEKSLALITIERGQVMRSQVIAVEGSSHELELDLGNEDAPNIYVSVTLLGRTNGKPDFRVGYLNLDVHPDAYHLQVQVQFSPENPQPGQDVSITLRAHDASGNPVQGIFSLALVDKAVLALADSNSRSIEESFYGKHSLGVQSSYALAIYSGRSLYIPPGRGGGGGGEVVMAQVGLREKFEDTAYWNGSLETDITGIAQVTLRLPDNLTTWQADTRGLTSDALVGSARADLLISKPLLIRPVTSRFVVVGDHLEMAAVVHNNTQNPVRASVRLEGSGFGLDDLNTAVQVIDLPPNGNGRVGWWGTVQDVKALSLEFSVESGELRDAARPEDGLLPVLRYMTPQVFGTSGMLSEPGSRLELISVPRSFDPSGGSLFLELSPSLSSVILDGLTALNEFPRDFTEPVLSRMLPNLMMYGALRDLQIEDNALLTELEGVVAKSVDQLVLQQNEDGGWGWATGTSSSPYLSCYVLFGLTKAYQSGVFVDQDVIQRGQAYLTSHLIEPGIQSEDWQLDQLAFSYFVLQQTDGTDLELDSLFRLRERLSPWGKAFLLLALEGQSPGDANAKAMLSDLQASASRSATGASWQDKNLSWRSWSTPNFTTSVVIYAIARLDPASPILPDGVRYLTLNRKPSGSWNSSYESAWALLALVETVRGTGDLNANYMFSASLNNSPLITGSVEGPSAAIRRTSSELDLSDLRPELPNALEIQHGEGSGQLYYRAYLNVSRPVEEVPVLSRGLTISRQYYLSGQDCRQVDCQPITSSSLVESQPLLVRLVLTVPEDMYYVVVEDSIPAGVEVLNPYLKTTQQYIPPGEPITLFEPENPFTRGWGWWLFQNPQIYNDRVRWVVDFLPAGTYELTYRVLPFLAGEFRLIPARAYQYYFPEVEGASEGALLTIN